MRIAFIGLGNMGGGMAANQAKAGRQVAAFDLSSDALKRAQEHGCSPVASVAEEMARTPPDEATRDWSSPPASSSPGAPALVGDCELLEELGRSEWRIRRLDKKVLGKPDHARL